MRMAPRGRTWIAYLMAVGWAAAAIAVRWLNSGLLDESAAFLLSLTAVALAGWVGGLGPALVATAFGGLATVYLFIPPVFTLQIPDPKHAASLLAYLATAGLVSFLFEAVHRSRRREARQAAELEGEVALRRTGEERMRLASEVARLGIIAIDYLTDTVTLSPEAGAILGLPAGEPLPRADLHTYFHPEDRAEILRRIDISLDPTGPGWFEMDHRVVRPDGSVRWLSVRKQVTFRDGRPHTAILVAQDITDRTEAEREKERLAITLDTFIQSAPIGLAFLDANLRYWAVNDCLAELNGLPVIAHLGRPMAEVLPHVWPTLQPVLQRVMENGEAVVNTEVTDDSPERGDKPLTCVVSYFPLRLADETLGVGVSVLDISARKSTEKRLREAEDHYRHAVELNPQIPWTAHADGYVFDFSSRWLDLTGLTREQAMGDGWKTTIHPDDLPDHAAAWQRSLDTGEAFDFEHRVRTAEGVYRWMRTRAAARRNEAGEVIRWYGSTEDIHTRKEAELALAASRELLRTVVEGTPDFIWVKDTAGRITFCNSATFALLGGGDPTRVLGDGAVLLPDPEQARVVAGNDRRVMTSGQVEQVEELFGPADAPLVFQSVKAPLRDATGQVIGVVGVSRDVTASRQAEQRMRASEERFRMATEALQGVVYEVNVPTGTAVYSRGLHALLGFTPSEAGSSIGWWMDRWHPDDAERLRQQREAAEARSEMDFHVEYRVRHRDGRWLWVADNGIVERREDGTATRVFGCLIDITARRQAEDELRLITDRFQAALQASPVVVFNQDRDLRYVWVHNPTFNMTAYDILGKTDSDLLERPEDAERIEGLKREVMATGVGRRVEVSICHAGVPRVYDLTVQPQRDGTGVVVGVTCAAVDITALKEAEERQAFLLRLSDVLRPLGDPTAVQVAAARVLGEYLGASRCGYAESDDDGESFEVRPHYEVRVSALPPRLRTTDFGAALTEHLRAGQLLLRADATTDPQLSPAEKLSHESVGVVAQAVLPLVKGGRLEAVLFVHYSERHVWTDAEVGLIRETAERTWAAVEWARAEQQLRASEERFRMAADAVHGLLYEAVPSTNTVWRSNALEHLLGFRPEEAAPTFAWWYDRIHPDDLSRLMAEAEKNQAERHEYFSNRYRVRHRAGHYVHVWEQGQARYHPDGTVARTLGCTLDVTAEVDAVQALTESEEQYRDLFNSIDIGFCVLEMIGEPGAWADYRFVSVNPVFERHTGLSNAVGHTARELVPGLEDIWVDMYGRVAETGELFRFTEESPAMGRWFDVSAVRVGGPHGWRVALLFNDISHQKRAEQTIRASERQLRAMADAMPQVVWVADANGQVTYYNSRVRGFLGVRENSDGTWEWEPVLHPDDLERTAADWSKAVADRTPYQCEHRVSMADGTYRWHLSRGVPVDSTGMGVMQWFGTATDIHDLKLAQEALQQADRRKDEFLATLAHELRNPLAPIRNGLYVLRMQANDPSGREKTVAMMERQLGHMVVLIDDLLDVSRITRGKLTLRREPVDLSVAIDMAIEAAQPLIQQNAHTLDVRVVTGPLTVHGDVNRLAQVVGNLLTNSAKYTPRGGHITLLAEREADTAVISVLDTGIGIPQASLERVFDLFSQIDRTLEKTTGGLGIGLALVRGLVEMHGGSVTAFSDGEGKGSKFTVRLPLLGTTRLAPVASNGVMANGTANRQRVLVADDNVDAADSLAAMLQLAGHDVRVARDGVEAVTVAEQFHPQLILMDVGMPRLNGLEATRRIRSQPWGRKVRIVALTGWGQEADREKTAAAGCDRHFVKPVSLSDVTDLLSGSAITSHESRSTEAR